jgi:hypothetical protein
LGERRTIDGLRRWWQRSFRLLPNPAFEVEGVIVAGGPWVTRIATRVRVHVTMPNGPRPNRATSADRAPAGTPPCPQLRSTLP